MPRKAWRVRGTKTRLSDVTRVFLATRTRPDGHLATFTMLGDAHQLRTVWSTVGRQFLADWVQAHPCTRPWPWWELEAPEPRRRTGGSGVALHSVLAVAPCYRWQIPTAWVRRDHAKLLGVGPAVDPEDPPRHESQAAYLQRLGLLSTEERHYLSTHPELLTDEILR